MKGRSVWNKPSVRKTDVYKLLIKLGGKARWKHLKAHLKDLGWGPTTLKQTLDEMVKEGSIIKEAVAGDKGPEVWYKARIWASDGWKKFEEFLDRRKAAPSFEEMRRIIREKMQKLEEVEKEAFLRGLLRDFVETADELYKVSFCLGIDELIYRPEGAGVIIDTIFEVLKEETKNFMRFFLEYPEISAGVVVDILNEIGVKHAAKEGKK
ncbi:MAG: hypothetical protein QMD13_03510 [Candidatus Bathyarchaeia archaeon]|nr:hypothetical protein [Candidatus Bathyarchaeia archaeon]